MWRELFGHLKMFIHPNQIFKSLIHKLVTKKTEHAILELDMNFVSSRRIRRSLSISRPHLQSITIDIAFIISKPGIFRVDKVDIKKFTVKNLKAISL